jgi:7-keto-8-aminopelargonate synthetase-like enzyme
LIQNPSLLTDLSKNIQLFHEEMKDFSSVFYLTNDLNSPIIHMKFIDVKTKNQDVYLEKIAENCLNCGFAVSRSKYSKDEYSTPSPSLRICLTSSHDANDIKNFTKTLKNILKEIKIE